MTIPPTAAASYSVRERPDRSPCGTGTSAKLACGAGWQVAAGEIWRRQHHRQPVYRQLPAHRGRHHPTIRGEARVCGDNQLILNPDDPFCWGSRREAVRRHRDRRRDHRRRLRVAAGEAGQSVTLIDNGQPGATAAGMGHLVCMDDDPAELALSAWSLERWRAITPRMPDIARGCGTLWLAESEEEMTVADENSGGWPAIRCTANARLRSRSPGASAAARRAGRRAMGTGRWHRLRAERRPLADSRCRRPSYLPAR